jgi:hypothetical protein
LSCASSAEAQLLFLAQHEVEHKQHKGNEWSSPFRPAALKPFTKVTPKSSWNIGLQHRAIPWAMATSPVLHSTCMTDACPVSGILHAVMTSVGRTSHVHYSLALLFATEGTNFSLC